MNHWKLIPNLWHAESGQESQMISLQSIPSGGPFPFTDEDTLRLMERQSTSAICLEWDQLIQRWANLRRVFCRCQTYAITVSLSDFYFLVHAGLSFTLIICEVLLSSIAQTATLCKIYFEVQTKYLSLCVQPCGWMYFYGSVSPWFLPSKQEYTMCSCFAVSLGCWCSLLQYDYNGIAN